MLLNQATGGAGAVGGTGGNGQGGGIFNGGSLGPFSASDIKLFGCRVEFNQADGGAAGPGGTAGQGIGGGVFNLGTFTVDGTTVIAQNLASTSDDNIYP